MKKRMAMLILITSTCTRTLGGNENEDRENENLRPITKTKTRHVNEDTLLKVIQKRLALSLRTKVMFMRHYENEDPHGNLEF